ncbi:hypothetical protein B0T10DRAFT_585465 [Thelonectria olida]|uniref:Fungal N-terminal domain-containing protein n=1 Tax=Thelonectria olida TaxID=1576542 RepID=A0A9P9AJU5_9HYPO|nr:hypothetical protein B0T10DRAFT_585465 [Thelonectria olida]
MDPITALGAAAAASQFGVYGVKGLVNLIQLVGQFRDTPSRVRELLQDVQNSVTGLSQLKQALQDPNSDIMQGLETRQRQSIQCILDHGHDAIKELEDTLKPLVQKKDGTMATGGVKTWKVVLSVIKTKDIEEKLRRIQRLYSDVLLQLQVTDIELQVKLRTISARISRSVDDGLQSLSLQMTSLESTSHSTDQRLQLVSDNLIVAGGTRIESSLNTMQPMLMSLQQEHKFTHEGIGNLDRRVDTLDESIVAATNKIMTALTNHQSHLTLSRNITQLSATDKADIANQITRDLIASPSTLRDAFRKKTAKKSRKYSITVHFYPLLRKALHATFASTSGPGGYSLHHSLHVYATVKRSESPLFSLLDQCFKRKDVRRRVALHNLLDEMRRALEYGGCHLTDRDEDGRTVLHGIIENFGGAEGLGDDLADEFLQFWQLLGSVCLDLSARAPSRIVGIIVGLRMRARHVADQGLTWEYRSTNDAPLTKGLTVQEYALTTLCRASAFRAVGGGALSQFIQKFEPEDYLHPSLDGDLWLPRSEQSSGWVRIFHKRPELVELFSDSTGLGSTIVRKLSSRLRTCYRKWCASFSCQPDVSSVYNDAGSTEKASRVNSEDGLWSLGFTPLELSLGWPEGMRILFEEGAEPGGAEELSTAALLGHLESLRLLLDVEHSKGVTATDILVVFNHWGPAIEPDSAACLVGAAKLRRQMLAQLALRHLPKSQHGQLGLSLNAVLDTNAFAVYDMLVDRGIEVPQALLVDDKPIYHHLISAEWCDLWFDNGFREIDASFMGITPFEATTKQHRKGDLLRWFLSKGAKPQLHPRLNWAPGDAFNLALNLSDWLIFYEKYPYLFTYQYDVDATLDIIDNGSLRIIDDALLIWADETHLSNQEAQDAYEASCRLEIFERLEMAHTCLPHGVHPHLEPAESLSRSEIQALQEEDEESNHHLELLMKAYRTCRSMHLPQAPTPTDYSDNLKEWWEELDQILPEIDYDRDREEQIAEALGEAGYLGHLSEGEETGLEPFSSTACEMPDFEHVIWRHFSRYLTEEGSAGLCSDTEDEWVTESEWESDTEPVSNPK